MDMQGVVSALCLGSPVATPPHPRVLGAGVPVQQRHPETMLLQQKVQTPIITAMTSREKEKELPEHKRPPAPVDFSKTDLGKVY